jgi:hypothetical protein
MEASEFLDEHDFNLWTSSLTDKTIKLSLAKMPKIHGSYDMAWQQKGSGHQYNSLSGHGSLVGRRTRKVVGLLVKLKICNACTLWAKKNPNTPMIQHNCYKNHHGSSGCMESAAILEIIVQSFEEFQVVVELLCCDDDSSIRADCQWSNKDYMANNNTDVLPMVKKKVGKNKGEFHPRPDKGKLPAHVPEPRFVADPNHRRKGLTGDLIKLDMSKVNEKFTMTRMDSTRLGKNFGYMVRTLKDRPQCEFITAAEAVLEHHFDVHDNCHSNWCPRKGETEEERKASTKYYRNKEKDAKLYAVIKEKMSRFISIEKLQEMAHDMDTNMNEGFNNICTWFLPKNKVFAGCGSLNNRISFAVGINSIGVLPFYTRLFRKMGINMTENVKHYLQVKETSRMRKIEGGKTQLAKKNRNKAKYEKLKDATRLAKKEFLKREGAYRRGMNMDDPFSEMLNGQELVDDERKPAAKKRKMSGFCEYCGRSDHLTKRSSSCMAKTATVKMFRRMDGSLLSNPPTVIDVDERNTVPLTDAAQDIDRLDSLPFDHEMPSDDDDSLAGYLASAAFGRDESHDDEDEVAFGTF